MLVPERMGSLRSLGGIAAATAAPRHMPASLLGELELQDRTYAAATGTQRQGTWIPGGHRGPGQIETLARRASARTPWRIMLDLIFFFFGRRRRMVS